MRNARRAWNGAALAAPFLFVASSALAGQELTWLGSVDVASGDYLFTERTTSFYLLNGLSMRLGDFRVGASLPSVLQDNPVVTTVGSFSLPTGGSQHGELRGRGGSGASAGMGSMSSSSREPVPIEAPGAYEISVGDPLFTASFDIDASLGPLRSVRIGASAKPPLNDADSGVGTGAWDAGAGVGISMLAGPLIILLDATYWTFGDFPDLELKDAIAYGGAVGGSFGQSRLGWSVSVLGTTEIIEGTQPPVSAGGDLLLTLPGGRGFRAGIRVGLTESAADLSASAGWRIPLAGGL